MLKFVKIIKVTHEMNWWNNEDILGKTFEVLDIYNGCAKIEYYKNFYGWLPLEVCEVNPHLKLV